MSTDTRTLRAGDLFVALRGERFDGHAFLAQATSGGASGGDGRPRATAASSSCRRWSWSTTPRSRSARSRALARAVRAGADRGHRLERQDHGQGDARLDPARPCRRARQCSPPRGNLNNDIGVPLTLLRLRDAPSLLRDRARHEPQGRDRLARRHRAPDRRAGQQRAARAPGVHALGARRSRPRTRASSTRCRADGVAVINADDAQAALLPRAARARAGGRFRRSTRGGGDRPLQLERLSSEIALARRRRGARDARDPGPAQRAQRARAAAACAFAVGIDAKTIAQGLGAFRPYTGRLQVKQATSGATRHRRHLQRQSRTRCARRSTCSPRARRRPRWCSATWAKWATQGAEFHREVGAYARGERHRRSCSRSATRRGMRSRRSAPARATSTSVDELVSERRGQDASWSRARAS